MARPFHRAGGWLALVPAASRSAGLARDRQVFAVVPSEHDADELVDDLRLFTEAHLIPAWETLPFEHISPNLGTMARRAQGRHLFGDPQPGRVLVAPVRAAIQRLSPSFPYPVVMRRGDEVALPESGPDPGRSRLRANGSGRVAG